MAYGTVNADVIGTSVAGSNLGAGDASLMKNRIINGDMRIFQRATSVTSSGYFVDRWSYNASVASKGTATQSTSVYPTGFNASSIFTSSSAYSIGAGDYFGIQQAIEGYNIADLGFGTANAKTVTVSFWVRSSLTGTFGGCLQNNAGNRSYPFTYTISAANTWEQKSVTIAGDTSGTWETTNSTGLYVFFGLGVGSTYSTTAGAWAAGLYLAPTGATSVVGTSGATFYITGVQLEVGSSATGFEYRQYGQELALCQRYFQTSTIGIPVDFWGGFGGTVYASGTQAFGCATYKITMRAAPTVVLYDGNGAGVCTQNGIAGGIAATAALVTAAGFTGINRTSGSFSTTTGYQVLAGFTASAEL